jgi:predicted O-methyltransferase YrrM
METLAYIIEKYNLTIPRRSPIEIPDTGRAQLAELFGELGYKVGAEIGTERGLYAEIICKANPGVRLYCVDPYEVYSGYRDYNGKEQRLYSSRAEAEERLAPYKVLFLRRYSMDACMGFDDRSLDFVYIDAHHGLKYIVEDLWEWTRIVRPGGIIAGHDYAITLKNARDPFVLHIKYGLKAFADAFDIRPIYVLGRYEKVEGETRDNWRSWLFQNP